MHESSDTTPSRRSRRGRGQQRENSDGSRRIMAQGGRFMPLSATDAETIQQAAFDILARIGMAQAPRRL
jgi:trimethylamine:corrinoid methyltransferase-like protein